MTIPALGRDGVVISGAEDARGEVVWDNDSCVFLDGGPAATVHPRAGLTRRG